VRPPLFHPQPRAPLFPLPCDRCNPCLQRTVSRDVCARPFTLQGASFSSCAPLRPMPEAARVPGTPTRGAPPCMRATSQRAFAPAERQAASVLSEPLHPGQPMLACARPRSGRSPLPSDCTRGNPCLLARNLAAGARPCRASSSERPLGTSAPGATHVCSECSSGTPARDYISHVRSACSSGTPAHGVCMHPAHVRSYSGRSPLLCDKQRVLLRDARNYLFYVRSACFSGTPAHSGRSPLCMTTRGRSV
jgi:hypothetical protein